MATGVLLADAAVGVRLRSARPTRAVLGDLSRWGPAAATLSISESGLA